MDSKTSHRTVQIIDAISVAEKRVLGFLSEAASDGDYELIDFARRAATGLHYLRLELTPRAVNDAAIKPDAHAVRHADPIIESTKSGTQKKKMEPGSYPLFEVRDNSLVKTGWSKKQGTTYEQRVPRRTFDTVLSALEEVAKRGSSPVATDSILEIVNASDNPPPSYQTYSVIAFLRSEGVIRQVTRGEYTVPGNIGVNARAAWNRIARV